MIDKLAALLLSTLLIFQVPPQPEGSAAALATGVRQVEEGDLEAAVITLDGVVRQLSSEKHREKDLSVAHLYLSMAYLGLSQWERAKADMREAWKNNKDMKLDPKKFSPRVMQLYEETRRGATEGEPKATTATTTTTTSASPSPPPAAVGGGEKKGGSSKGILIGLGVAAVLVGGVVLAVGSKGTTTTTTIPRVLVGSFRVSDGPRWDTNPRTYSCLEACAQVFGGAATQYFCSTTSASINHLAFLDGWADAGFCTNAQSESFKLNTSYNCGTTACAYSAYVSDHCTAAAVNYCFR